MKTETEAVPMRFTGLKERGSIPGWAREFNAERTTAKELAESEDLPGIIVLSAGDAHELASHRATVGRLSKRLQTTRSPYKLVVSFSKTAKTDPEGLSAMLGTHFRDVIANVEVSVGKESLKSNVFEALAKYLVQAEEAPPDPLASALEVQKARKGLIARDSGRLDATKIAQALGMSTASLAKLIGKHRATVSKTPDAPALQTLLRPYERILRLRALLPAQDFVAWLEAPNRHLDGRTPRELINEGRAGLVADLAEDALTGQPT